VTAIKNTAPHLRQQLNRVQFPEEAIAAKLQHCRCKAFDAAATAEKHSNIGVAVLQGCIGTVAAQARYDHVFDLVI